MKIKNEVISYEEIREIEKSRVTTRDYCDVCCKNRVLFCTSKWKICSICTHDSLSTTKTEYLAKRVITRAKYPINKIIKYQKKGE